MPFEHEYGDSTPEINTEIWKVLAFEPSFEVSSFGSIRRATACRSHAAGYVLGQSQTKNGYMTTSLRGRPYYVHRLVAAAFFSDIPEGLVVNHLDHNRKNNRLENLEIVTVAENNAHARRSMRPTLAEKHQESILALSIAGLSHRKIAARLGIDAGVVRRMLSPAARANRAAVSQGGAISTNAEQSTPWKSIGALTAALAAAATRAEVRK